MKAIAVALLWIAIAAHGVIADPEPEASFRAALTKAAAGDPSGITELEALGAARPVSRWSDDAWSEAARLAERAGDYARARKDLEQVLAVADEAAGHVAGIDDQLVRRARGALTRLTSVAGATGEWSAIAAEHDRLAQQLQGPVDPRPAIDGLRELIATHPTYPRITSARLALAQGLERDARKADAMDELHAAIDTAPRPDDRLRADFALIHLTTRIGELDMAETEIAAVTALIPNDRVLIAELQDELDTAQRRRYLRIGLASLLVVLVLAATVMMRRDAGSWRSGLRALIRPPVEVWYLAPVALVLALVSISGNPLVGRAVRAIAIAGIAICWLSGSLLELARKRGTLRTRRAITHTALAVIAAAASVYLVIDHDRLIDLVVETWRSGPAAR